MKKIIKDLSFEELSKVLSDMGEKPHRADQIYDWVYKKHISSFQNMTNIPGTLKNSLEETFFINALRMDARLESRDGTIKFLWGLLDGEYIESVVINDKKRRTLCVSSQVGCKIKCPFCASGQFGFKRNLTPGEIIDQVIFAERIEKIRITNIVFMGMGEPMDNFNNVIKAVRTINSNKALGIGARKITVSTCGIVPGILKLKDIGLQVELSVSLHAVNDILRNELVPINRQYPLCELVRVCGEYFDHTGRVVTLEYTLIPGRNDSLKDADELAVIARKIRAKVNLIICSGSTGYRTKRIGEQKLKAFRDRILAGGVTATWRRSRGEDIQAACGQLAAQRKREIS